MAIIYDMVDLGIKFPGAKASEGNLTIQEGDDATGIVRIPVFENPLRKGDWVKIVGDHTYEKAEDGDVVVGRVASNPSFDGKTPITDSEAGEYEPRKFTVELTGKSVKTVPVVEENEAIDIGDSVTINGNSGFQKGDNTNTLVLKGILAETVDTIDVLFNYYNINAET